MSSQLGDSKTWIWCARCERCYTIAEARRTDTLRMCAYEDCDGVLATDGLFWSVVQRRHPHLPDAPERAVCYPGLLNGDPAVGPCAEHETYDKHPRSAPTLPDFLA